MKKTNIITYLFLCVFSLSLLVYIIPQYSPPYEGEGIPAALLPQILACITLVLSGLLLFKECISANLQANYFPISGDQFKLLAKYLGIFVLTLVVMDYFGYLCGGFVAMIGLQLLLKQKQPYIFVAMTIFVPLILYYCVIYGLAVPLP